MNSCDADNLNKLFVFKIAIVRLKQIMILPEGIPEELAFELEALEHVIGFGDDDNDDGEGFTIAQEVDNYTTVSIPLTPRNIDGAHEAYVSALLQLKIDTQHYPTTPIITSLHQVKGLTDAACAALQASLASEAQNLAGEMVIGHLCELALDEITNLNHPTGNCIFCLEDLILQPLDDSTLKTSLVTPAYSVLKLPCYHCFHFPCFSAYFNWVQREQNQQLAPQLPSPQLHLHRLDPGGPSLPPRREDISCENGYIARGVFPIRCPSCRIEVTSEELRHALPIFQKNQQETRNISDSSSTLLASSSSSERVLVLPTAAAVNQHHHPSTTTPADLLPSDLLNQLRQLQHRFSQVLQIQRGCNGLVQESVAVSVAELEAVGRQMNSEGAAAATASCVIPIGSVVGSSSNSSSNSRVAAVAPRREKDQHHTSKNSKRSGNGVGGEVQPQTMREGRGSGRSRGGRGRGRNRGRGYRDGNGSSKIESG